MNSINSTSNVPLSSITLEADPAHSNLNMFRTMRNNKFTKADVLLPVIHTNLKNRDSSNTKKKVLSSSMILSKNIIKKMSFKSPKSEESKHLKYINEDLKTAESLKTSLSPSTKIPFTNLNYYRINEIKEEEVDSKLESSNPSKNQIEFLKKINLKRSTQIKILKNKMYYYVVLPGNNSEMIKKCMAHRLNWKESNTVATLYNFKWQHISTGIEFNKISKSPMMKQMVNHLEFHSEISNKLNLFVNLMRFCEKRNLEVFSYIPFTIIMLYNSPTFPLQYENFTDIFYRIKEFTTYKSNFTDIKNYSDNYAKYASIFKLGIHLDKVGHKTSTFIHKTFNEGQNMWLVKAIDLNRGRCIQISDQVDGIKNIMKKFYEGVYRDIKNAEKEETALLAIDKLSPKKETLDKQKKGKILSDFRRYRSSCVLVQKYLEKPLLYYGRKFDVRIWVLYSHKDVVYAFKEGHLKTSSQNYDIYNMDKYIHLTNYSVQKYNKEFAKFEIGNEVSFGEFQGLLDKDYGNGIINVRSHIFAKIKKLICLTFHSVKEKINMNQRKFCFEIFGFDFIIDRDLEVFLLEVNTNPGLEESSPLIKQLLPRLIDDALKITIDDVFETKYNFEETGGRYFSPYSVDGYSDYENMWEFVTDFSDYNDY